MPNIKEIYIVIPVFNEGKVICDVIADLRQWGYYNLIIVDDGSSDNTYSQALSVDAITLRHKINRGKGAAVKTGFAAAKLLGAGIVVTMDGDGQHDPQDIENLTKPILEEEVDVVLGSRLLNTGGMPFIKVIANKIGNIVTIFLS